MPTTPIFYFVLTVAMVVKFTLSSNFLDLPSLATPSLAGNVSLFIANQSSSNLPLYNADFLFKPSRKALPECNATMFGLLPIVNSCLDAQRKIPTDDLLLKYGRRGQTKDIQVPQRYSSC